MDICGEVSGHWGMAHVIPLERRKLWLVNKGIDLITWNELHA